MSNQLLLTITGQYQFNLVKILSERTHALDGKWLNSKINHIDNKMAGLIKIELDQQHLDTLINEFKQLGLNVSWEILSSLEQAKVKHFSVTIDAKDRLGLVRDISSVLSDYDLQVQNMECNRIGVPDIGGTVFTSHFQISTANTFEQEQLVIALQQISPDIVVDIKAS